MTAGITTAGTSFWSFVQRTLQGVSGGRQRERETGSDHNKSIIGIIAYVYACYASCASNVREQFIIYGMV